jgi:hypothetical protein
VFEVCRRATFFVPDEGDGHESGHLKRRPEATVGEMEQVQSALFHDGSLYRHIFGSLQRTTTMSMSLCFARLQIAEHVEDDDGVNG